MNLKVIFASFVVLSFGVVSADWDPEMCWMDADLSGLSEPGFIAIKQKVLAELKNSWCSQEKVNLLMDLVLVEQPKVCVEIGAFTGSSVLPVAVMLSHFGQGKFYAIDAWSNDVAIRSLGQNDPNRSWWSTVDMKSVRNSFQELMGKWDVNKLVQEVALSSDEAIDQIKEEIDFLHIDGDYSIVQSVKDVAVYLPKVKQGGYILFSNLYVMINGKQPKVNAFCDLLDTCEIVAEIENGHAILLKKM